MVPLVRVLTFAADAVGKQEGGIKSGREHSKASATDNRTSARGFLIFPL